MDDVEFLDVSDSLRKEIRQELIDAMMYYAAHRPRSLQKHIGPSQAGTTCARKLAYALNAETKPREEDNPLPSMIGTAMHETQEEVFLLQNALLAKQEEEEKELKELMDILREKRDAFGELRWLTETKVLEPIPGTCDLYDIKNGAVIDHKFLGPTTHPANVKHLHEDYRIQVHLYGAGMKALGYDVRYVCVFMVPRGGRLKDSELFMEPFDPEIAAKAFERVQQIQTVADAFDVKHYPYRYRFIPATPSPSNCQFCPHFVPGPETGNPYFCPGQSGTVDENGHLVVEE